MYTITAISLAILSTIPKCKSNGIKLERITY